MWGDFMDVNQINSLVLAFLGDAVYEKYIRSFLIKTGINNVNKLQQESVKYVCAKAQAKWLDFLIKKELLSQEEITVIKRARNAKSSTRPKNVDVMLYKHATGLEALIGYLYMNNDYKRIDEILEVIVLTKIADEGE